uniref:Ras-GAP domain-containing protein n=1 Tax=Rhabditophanes sp. KR3021 TaxID=114890 RepID=A0AC35TWP4_9BILA
MDSFASLSNLCDKLGAEKLLTSNELGSLQALNCQIDSQMKELSYDVWITKQKQQILTYLIHHHPSVTPDNCCQILNRLTNSTFNESWKILGHHHSSLTQIFNLLFLSPQTIAQLLSSSDVCVKANVKYSTEDLVRSIHSVIFGSCVFPQDERQALTTLSLLIPLQIMSTEDPRKLLRRANTSISKLFRLFFDGLYPAKIFITSALHESILNVLSADDVYLDMDQSKILHRFSKSAKQAKFGKDETSFAYLEKVTSHRQQIATKLVGMTKQFIEGIMSAMICFPNSLTWLLKEIKREVMKSDKGTNEAIILVCTDLIFTHFICPAISNPENLGIIGDTPISTIARFNLMQIGQIIQSLALVQFEKPNYYAQDIFEQLDNTALCSIVNSILNSADVTVDSFLPSTVNTSDGDELYYRRNFVCSIFEANVITAYLRSPCLDVITDQTVRRDVRNLLLRMPSDLTQDLDKDPKRANTVKKERAISPTRGINKLKSIADKGKRFLNQSPSKAPFLRSDSLGNNLTGGLVGPSQSLNNIAHLEIDNNLFDVIILPIGDAKEPFGLMSEDKFMTSLLNQNKNGTSIEKKARFVTTNTESLISDRTIESVVDGEGRDDENQSICSSLEDNLPNDNDNAYIEDIANIPDTYSAASNSVRGSSSNGSNGDNDDDDDNSVDRRTSVSMIAVQMNDTATSSTRAPIASEKRALIIPHVPVTVRKQNPEGLEEQFGKFGIPENPPGTVYKDETYSLVSDSWSTDVVPSDNETIGERSERNSRMTHGNATATPVANANLLFPIGVPTVEDRSDTWSLDAIASDSEADQLAALNKQKDVDIALEMVGKGSVADGEASSTNSNTDREKMRRQSSGSSLYSYECQGRSNRTGSELDFNAPIDKKEGGTSKVRQGISNIKKLPVTLGINKKKHDFMAGFQKKAEQAMSTIKNSISHHGDFSTSPKISSPKLIECNSTGHLMALGEEASTVINEQISDDLMNKYKNSGNRRPLDGMNCNNYNEDLASIKTNDCNLYYDEDNLKECRAFLDAKKKLRLVLSGVDSLQSGKLNASFIDFSGDILDREKTFLIGFLNLLLAEALNNSNGAKAAQIRETIRCLSIFSGKALRKLIKILKEEYRKRSAYHIYLQQSKMVLLQLQYFLGKLGKRINSERNLIESCLIQLLVRTFMSKNEEAILTFTTELMSISIDRADEKTDLVERFLDVLDGHVRTDQMWFGADEELLGLARKYIERALFSNIHSLLMYPLDDLDMMRDQVFYNAVKLMSASIDPNHVDIKIPKKLQGECPWPSAQSELAIINAYKRPSDKMACIVRCVEEIENLICLSQTASADDLTPVLVYVILQANPMSLNSTIQFIGNFHAKNVEGKEAYIWTQFTSAVEFIKSLINKHL